MYSEHKKNSQDGQVLLLVVLASVIALTVGLAAVSRSITSTRISTEESNSQKALSAAEAGVEEQINKALTATGGESITDTTQDLNNNSSFIATAEPLDGTDFEINNGEAVNQDDGADIWLSKYPDFSSPILGNYNITVFWNAPVNGGSGCDTSDPAIEVVVLYGASKTDPKMSRYAIDGCVGRRSQNHFSIPTSTESFPSGYNQRHTITNITNGLPGYIMRIIPLYADAKIAVRSSVALPAQGYTIESTGSSGDTVRKVQVSQGFPKLPIEFFPYNLFLP